MNLTTYHVLVVVAAILSVLTYLTAFVIVILRRRQATTAATYLLVGLSFLAGTRLFQVFGMAVMGQLLTVDAMAQVVGWSQLFGAIANAVALGCFIAAAFTERRPEQQLTNSPDHDLPSNKAGHVQSSNPYFPPN